MFYCYIAVNVVLISENAILYSQSLLDVTFAHKNSIFFSSPTSILYQGYIVLKKHPSTLAIFVSNLKKNLSTNSGSLNIKYLQISARCSSRNGMRQAPPPLPQPFNMDGRCFLKIIWLFFISIFRLNLRTSTENQMTKKKS